MGTAQIQNTGVANNPVIQLRQRANFWQAQHACAVKREAALEKRIQQLGKEHSKLHAQVKEKDQQIEALKAKLVVLPTATVWSKIRTNRQSE